MNTVGVEALRPALATPRPPRAEHSGHLVVRIGDQLIVFPDTEVRGPTCIAAKESGRRCSVTVQDEGYGGWSQWPVPDLDGEVSALEPIDDANFLRQRCSEHLHAETRDLLAPTWVPFSPDQHADLVVRHPRTVWTPEGLRTLKPIAEGREQVAEDDGLADLISEALANRTDPPDETALYKWYDSADRLLYIGVSHDLAVRTASHIYGSSWMDFAVRSTIGRYPTRKAAEVAEREAIKAEEPLFNYIYNDTPPARRRLVEYLIEQGRTDLLAAAVSRG